MSTPRYISEAQRFNDISRHSMYTFLLCLRPAVATAAANATTTTTEAEATAADLRRTLRHTSRAKHLVWLFLRRPEPSEMHIHVVARIAPPMKDVNSLWLPGDRLAVTAALLPHRDEAGTGAEAGGGAGTGDGTDGTDDGKEGKKEDDACDVRTCRSSPPPPPNPPPLACITVAVHPSSDVDATRRSVTLDGAYDAEVGMAELFLERTPGRYIVDGLLKGINGVVMVYGITGSGKRHTMGSPRHDNAVEGRQAMEGVVHVALSHLFDRLRSEGSDGHVDERTDGAGGREDGKEGAPPTSTQSTSHPRPCPRQTMVDVAFVTDTNDKFEDEFSATLRDNSLVGGGGDTGGGGGGGGALADAVAMGNAVDLSRRLGAPGAPKKMRVREGVGYNPFLHPAPTWVPVHDADEALAAFAVGQKALLVRSCRMGGHTNSQRTNEIMFVRVRRGAEVDGGGGATEATLTLVKLKGSERCKKEGAGTPFQFGGGIVGGRLPERYSSLTSFRDVVCAAAKREKSDYAMQPPPSPSLPQQLRPGENMVETEGDSKKQAGTLPETRGRKVYVPYRNSPLTHLLRPALGGSSRAMCIATIRPEARCVDETVSTLRLMQRLRQVRNAPTVFAAGAAEDIARFEARLEERAEQAKVDKAKADKSAVKANVLI